MAQALSVMVVAMVIAVGVMLVFAEAVGDFVTRHPSMKILALSFLLLIGVLLVADGFGHHVEPRLRLLRDGVLAGRRAAQHAAPQKEHKKKSDTPTTQPTVS